MSVERTSNNQPVQQKFEDLGKELGNMSAKSEEAYTPLFDSNNNGEETTQPLFSGSSSYSAEEVTTGLIDLGLKENEANAIFKFLDLDENNEFTENENQIIDNFLHEANGQYQGVITPRAVKGALGLAKKDPTLMDKYSKAAQASTKPEASDIQTTPADGLDAAFDANEGTDTDTVTDTVTDTEVKEAEEKTPTNAEKVENQTKELLSKFGVNVDSVSDLANAKLESWIGPTERETRLDGVSLTKEELSSALGVELPETSYATPAAVAMAKQAHEGDEEALKILDSLETTSDVKGSELLKNVDEERPGVGDLVYMDDTIGSNPHIGYLAGYTEDGRAIIAEANSAKSNTGTGATLAVYDFNTDSGKSIKGFIPLTSPDKEESKDEETVEKADNQAGVDNQSSDTDEQRNARNEIFDSESTDMSALQPGSENGQNPEQIIIPQGEEIKPESFKAENGVVIITPPAPENTEFDPNAQARVDAQDALIDQESYNPEFTAEEPLFTGDDIDFTAGDEVTYDFIPEDPAIREKKDESKDKIFDLE